MNSQLTINYQNQQLQARLSAENIDYTWKDVSVKVDSDTPVWVAEVAILTPHGTLLLWVSYDEYLPQFLIEDVDTNEQFETEGDYMLLDDVIHALQLVLPHYDSEETITVHP